MKVRVPAGAQAAAVLAVAACADDATEGSAEPGGERLYVLWSGLSGPELDTNYITPIRSLDAGGVVDYARAIERPGIARLYGQDGVGTFAVGDGEAQTIVVGRSLRGCGVAMAARRLSVVCCGSRTFEPAPHRL